MITVRFRERMAETVVDRGSAEMPAVPDVSHTVRLPSMPDELAATVMGVEWQREASLHRGMCEGSACPAVQWVAEVWVSTTGVD